MTRSAVLFVATAAAQAGRQLLPVTGRVLVAWPPQSRRQAES